MDVLRADGPELADELHERQMLDAVNSALDQLPQLHRSILEQRFGLTGDAPRTPQRIAQMIHLSVAEITALERAGLEWLNAQVRSLYEA